MRGVLACYNSRTYILHNMSTIMSCPESRRVVTSAPVFPGACNYFCALLDMLRTCHASLFPVNAVSSSVVYALTTCFRGLHGQGYEVTRIGETAACR